mgnify:CR=1 FL=1
MNATEELPRLILTLVVFESAESLKTPVALDDERSTVVAPDVAALPYMSCLWTVKSPLAVPAIDESGVVRMTS